MCPPETKPWTRNKRKMDNMINYFSILKMKLFIFYKEKFLFIKLFKGKIIYYRGISNIYLNSINMPNILEEIFCLSVNLINLFKPYPVHPACLTNFFPAIIWKKTYLHPRGVSKGVGYVFIGS